MTSVETPIVPRTNQNPDALTPEFAQESIDALDALIVKSQDITDPGVSGAIDTPKPPVATPAAVVAPVVPPVAESKVVAPDIEAGPLALKPAVPVTPVEPVAPAILTPDPVEAEFEKIKLQGVVKPSITADFDKVKKVARERIAVSVKETEAARLERDTLQKEITELRANTKTLSPEIEKELTELRTVVAQQDVRYTPEYKIAATQRETAEKDLYDYLKTAGFSDTHIAEAKQIGPHLVDWDQVQGLTPRTKRAIDQKIGAMESAEQQIHKITEAAKTAPQTFVSPKDPRFWEENNKKVAELSKQWLPPLTPVTVPQGEPTDLKVMEAQRYNSLLPKLQETINEAQNDNSPEMKAMLVGGIAQLENLTHKHKITLLAFEEKQKTHTAEVERLNQEIKTRQDELDRIKNSSTVRLQTGIPMPSNPVIDGIKMDSPEALDKLIEQAKSGQL